MQTVRYKRGTLIWQAIGCLVIAAGGLWMAVSFNGQAKLLGILLALMLPFASIALMVRAFGDCVALQFDSSTLRVTTLLGGARLSWSQVRSLSREVVTQSQAFGLFKQDISFYLVITAVEDGGFERRFKVNERLLDWPRDGIPALVDDMARAQSSRAPAPPQPRAPTAAGPAPRGSFGRRTV